jgi:Asp-tRNA(Asn)/Glu-tRNA(Gln) amidotransferase A subunit family amidase
MGLSPGVLDQITKSDTLGLDGYRALLTRRAALRAEFEQLATTADAFVTLNALGAAPKGITYTGNASFNVAASVLGTPALALPVLFDDGMPLGLQLISGQHTDEKLFAIAGWILAHA